MKKCFIVIMTMLMVHIAGICQAQAFEDTDYVNPEGIVIASPAEGYRTTGSSVSILGACDYRYPLFLDGEAVKTTEHGFFTVYVSLEQGENVFEFENNGVRTSITIIRYKGTGGGTEPEYIPYEENVFGIVESAYTMRRADIYAQSPELIPLTKGTQLRILGEQGNFYRIFDGTYVSKSAISRYETALPENSVSSVYIEDDTKNNVVRIVFNTQINVPFSLNTQEDGTFLLRLYETPYAPCVDYVRNDTVKKVAVKANAQEKTTDFTISLKRDGAITGYDCSYENGKMIISLKKAPHLKGTISDQENENLLDGAVILLDAGHGGDDNGALGPLGELGAVEKDINLNITLYAAQYLREKGAEVVLTRSDDVFISLSGRVKQIRELQPDISVSIHGNSLPQESDYSKAEGFRTFYTYSFTGGVPAKINTYVAEKMDFTMTEIQRRSLSLTRLTSCPAMLLETLFLSNPHDYEFLIKAENQKKYGRAIAESIERYITQSAVYPGMHRYNVTRLTGLTGEKHGE